MQPTDPLTDLGRALIAALPPAWRPGLAALVTQRAATFINARPAGVCRFLQPMET